MPTVFFSHFLKDARGNTAITFALAALPLISVIGMTTDYSLAARRQSKINAFADAAALSTTTPAAMSLTAKTAQANAVNMFNAQMTQLGDTDVAYGKDVTITVTDTVGATTGRTTSVTWKATSSNAFSTLLDMDKMDIGGTATASYTLAANIDFYVMLDTSPSMAIPSSTAGIDTMVQQTGCAFACHWSNAPNGNDNYAIAKKNNVSLRMDLVKSSVANLYKTAKTTGVTNKAIYRGATYTFDASFKTITPLTPNLDQAQSDAADKVQMLTVFDQSMIDSKTNNNDKDTQWDPAMATMVAAIPTPGNGTSKSGDTPQEVLFIVTDGVVDETYPGYGPNDMTRGDRTITMPNYQKDYCTPLKNRGVRIAILYTTYFPLPGNQFYIDNVEPFQPKIPDRLQSCASPGLFFEVKTNGDIDGAMQALFAKAVATAHLTQ